MGLAPTSYQCFTYQWLYWIVRHLKLPPQKSYQVMLHYTIGSLKQSLIPNRTGGLPDLENPAPAYFGLNRGGLLALRLLILNVIEKLDQNPSCTF